MESQNILVTGASGLIGSALCAHLAVENRVVGLARFTDPAMQEKLGVLGVQALPFDAGTGDMRRIPGDFGYVFHELVMWSGDWAAVRRTNVSFLGRLMERIPGAKFIVGSTGGVYPASLTPQREDDPLTGQGQYGLSTVGKELLAQYFCEAHGIPVVILRYYWPYGPGGGIVAQLARQIAAGEALDLAHAPNRQPIYMDDCVQLTVAAARLCTSPAQVLNVGGEEKVSHEELAERIGYALGKQVRFTGTAPPPGERPSHLGDFARMYELLGRPQVRLEEGIRRTIAGMEA